MNVNNTPFKLFTLSVFIGLIVPVLIQDGMFMDGMLYTCVAHNLSNGIGTFWNPVFSETYFTSARPSFHEHPPLVFGIQAIFFKFLGSSMYVERLYSFLTACISALLIMRIWRLFYQKKTELKNLSWLPVLLWIIIPVGFWAFQNNMQENTMGIFILLAVINSLKVLVLKQPAWYNFIFSGIFIFLASLSKGIPGFFPLGIFFLFYLTHPKEITFKKMIGYSLITFVVPVALYALLMLWPEARESLIFYTQERLIGRVATTPTVDNRFSILAKLFMELLPAMGLMVLLLIVFAVKRIPLKMKAQSKVALFMILIGISGSIPIMLTMVQKAFYFTPSLPFFALGFAIVIAPPLNVFLKKYARSILFYKIALGISLVLLVSSIILSILQMGKTSRNNELLHDVYAIGEIVQPNSIIHIDEAMWNEWDLQCYLVRNYYISVDPNVKIRNYVLINNKLNQDTISNYKEIDIGLIRYHLFKKVD